MDQHLFAAQKVVSVQLVCGGQESDLTFFLVQILDFLQKVGIIQAVIYILARFRGKKPTAAQLGVPLQIAVFCKIPIQLVVGEEVSELALRIVTEPSPHEGEEEDKIIGNPH